MEHRRYLITTCLVILLFGLAASIAYAENLDNPSFETGNLQGWTIGASADSVTVRGADTVANSASGSGGYTTISPYMGNYMARLGTPGNTQPMGPTTLYQRFVVTDSTLKFAYNLCTYDYVGYDRFYYTVIDETTGETLDSKNLGSMWGSGTALKTTGWSYQELDVAGRMGHTLRLEISVQGTSDTWYATWAYLDSLAGDWQPPMTTYSLSGTTGSNGWYTSDVRVTLSATDVGGSGISWTKYSLDNGNTWTTYTGPFSIATEGTNTLKFYSRDTSGNTELIQSVPVKIDKTGGSPTLALSGTQGNNGWYRSNVQVTLGGSDPQSGVSLIQYSLNGGAWQTYSSPLTISAEGTSRVQCQVTNGAGLPSAYVYDQTVKIDKTAPTITGAPTTAANGNGWYKTDVTVHFTASDAMSGVVSVSPDQTLTGDGAAQSATGTVVDDAGNTASTTVSGINIDKTAPTISGAPTTAANGNGWYKTDVTVHFTASDVTSGVDTVTPDQTLTGEGAAQSVTGTVVDKAGNAASFTVSGINIDKTAPIISGAPTTAANANGWYKSDVTVAFTASDALSGVASVTPDKTLTGEGAAQSVTGTVVDKAGNTASATVSGINVDKTAPTISGAPTTAANANGWYNSDVTVHFTASDPTSGVASVSPDQTLTGEGADQSVTGTATDMAGNTASYTVSGIDIDKSAPTPWVFTYGTVGKNGWFVSNIQVNLGGTDSQSGISQIQYSLNGGAWQTYTSPFVLSTDGVTEVKQRAFNGAGISADRTWNFKIDKTAPTITGAPTTAANANGWYNSDVTVHFTAGDSVSGVASVTPDTVLTAEVAGQSVTGTVEDVAGNTASFTVGGINIDKTAPTISGAPTTAANANSWYNSDVTVAFSPADSLSGVDTVTPSQTLTGDGAAQSVTGTAVDKAGNSASYTVTGINIDKTVPTISGAPTTAANANGWYNSDVTVAFTASDATSGVESVTPDQTLTAEAAGQSVTGTVVDKAGNTASFTVGGINVDKTAPTISGAPDSLPNSEGWYNHDVTVAFSAGDELSGVESVTPDTVLTAEAENQAVVGTAVDKAGNSASYTVTGINIDKTVPTISGAPTTAANVNGWYNTDVAVHFIAGDTLSGVKSVTPDTTLTTEAADQFVTGTVVDLAGNTASATVGGINIDKTAPTISGAPTTDPNAAGWYNSDVTVAFTAGDGLSGVDTVTPDKTLTGDGAAQSVTGTVVDKAGNSASITIGDLNIDKTAPTISGTPTTAANANGWYNSDVTVHFTASDATSGVASVSPDETLTGEGAGQSVTGTVVDVAGNTASTTVGGINIDKTVPTISGAPTTAANANGWYNSDVVVAFTGNDALSGVDSVTAPVTVSAEGANQAVSGTVTDKAGNSATYTVTGINVDKTAPVIAINIPSDGAEYLLNQAVTADWSASDSLSGLATAAGTVANGAAVDTGSVNAKTFTVTAVDAAGNTATRTLTYSVRYAYGGVIEPIKDKAYKVNSAIPVKFQLKDSNGAYVTNAVAKLYVAKVTDGVVGSGANAVAKGNSNTDNLFRYDPTSNQYMYNLDTKTLAAGTWQLSIVLDDGTTKTATIQLR